LQWQRLVSDSNASTGCSVNSVDASGASVVIGGIFKDTSTAGRNSFIISINPDGSTIGTFTPSSGRAIQITSSSFAESSGSLTDAAGNMTDGSGGLSLTTGIVSDASGTSTYSLVAI
jgi:hypothetical protein